MCGRFFRVGVSYEEYLAHFELYPYPSEEMELWQVGRAVGNVRNQGPELIEAA